MGTIVVGFDGSPHSRAALEYAAREARVHGSDLRVVTVWHVPAMAYAAGLGPAPGFDPHELEEAAQATAAEASAQLGNDATQMKLETRVREEPTATQDDAGENPRSSRSRLPSRQRLSVVEVEYRERDVR
jgi:nucleotide-binding universal stress UspA family protein